MQCLTCKTSCTESVCVTCVSVCHSLSLTQTLFLCGAASTFPLHCQEYENALVSCLLEWEDLCFRISETSPSLLIMKVSINEMGPVFV